MNPRLLLDTHILIQWLADPKRLTREQGRALEAAMRREENRWRSVPSPLSRSRSLVAEGKLKLREHPSIFLEALENDRVYRILPLSSATLRRGCCGAPVAQRPGRPCDRRDRPYSQTPTRHIRLAHHRLQSGLDRPVTCEP